MRKRKRRDGFSMVPNVYFDSGVAAALGRDVWIVYLTIRRYEQRRYSCPRIENAMKEGWIVSWVNQKTIAVHVGMSRSTVTRAIATLKAIGWIDELRLKDNARAYKIGHDSAADDEGRVEPVYWADRWLAWALGRLPERVRNGWKHKHAQERHVALAEQLQRVADNPERAMVVRMRP